MAPPYRDVTVGDLLTRLAADLGEHPALLYESAPRYTFAQLDAEARSIGRGLMALGVGAGDRVVVWAANVPEWIVLQFALAKIGAVLVTANTSLRAKDIEYLIRQCEASTVISIQGFRDVDYVGALEEIGATGGRIPGLRRLIFVDGASGKAPDGFLPYSRLRAMSGQIPEAALASRSAAVGVDDVINMQYTSGTTGFPKGVMLSSRNIVNNAYALAQMLGYTTSDRAVSVRAALSLLRLRHRRARRVHARRLDLPPRIVRPSPRARDRRARPLHGALRRADDVSGRARASGICDIRSHLASYRASWPERCVRSR